jgi:simple sugar transport system permease protein
MSSQRSAQVGVPGRTSARFPIRLRLHDPTAVAGVGLRSGLIIFGLVLGFAVIALDAGLGLNIFTILWDSTFGTAAGLNGIVQYSTPLIIAACAVAIGRQVGLWNIGVDGQLFFGAWAAAGVAFEVSSLPAGVLIPLCLLASFLGGVGAILIPALLRVYLGVNEVVTTLMFTFIGPLWVAHWVTGRWAAGEGFGVGNVTSKDLPSRTKLPQIDIGSFQVGTGFLLSIAACIAAWLAFRYARSGFRARLVGSDEGTARYAGVSVKTTRLVVFLISGGVGGLCGGIVLLDQIHNLSVSGLSNNTGFLGVVVAVLALGSPLVCIPMGIILGSIVAASVGLQIAGISPNTVLFLFGTLILIGGLADVLARYRVTRPFASLRAPGMPNDNDSTLSHPIEESP